MLASYFQIPIIRLLIASEYEPFSIVEKLCKYLTGSASIVIQSPFIQVTTLARFSSRTLLSHGSGLGRSASKDETASGIPQPINYRGLATTVPSLNRKYLFCRA